MAKTMLSWRVHVGAATGDGEMHDPPMQLARSAELVSFHYCRDFFVPLSIFFYPRHVSCFALVDKWKIITSVVELKQKM